MSENENGDRKLLVGQLRSQHAYALVAMGDVDSAEIIRRHGFPRLKKDV